MIMKYLLRVRGSLLLCCGLCIFSLVKGQVSVNALGGNAVGPSGSVSYTIGQLDYISVTHVDGTITQGVQQPYEISFIPTTPEDENIHILYKVYPNPTSSSLVLYIDKTDFKDLSYALYNFSGTLILKSRIVQAETIINMQGYAPSEYLLHVTEGDQKIRIFKIIKNQTQ
jgi:Secretion system C-terminal sorting domain